MATYNYSIANDTANGSIDLDKLDSDISPSIPSLSYSDTDADELNIHFTTTLTTSEKTTLDGIVAAHASIEAYRVIIENAMRFFHDIMVVFAAENITMGITQSGKTKAVADYLQDVLRYGQSGSLYEVISEIDSLILAGVPTDLSPFVTVARLTEFKSKIAGYLA